MRQQNYVLWQGGPLLPPLQFQLWMLRMILAALLRANFLL